MKKIALALSALFVAGFVHAADMTEDQKTLYALGFAIGQQTSVFTLTPAELEVVKKGMTDFVATGKPAVAMETYGPKIDQLARTRRSAAGEKTAAAGREYADKAAKEQGAVKTPSGLVYNSVKEGSGASPRASDTVEVHYRGTLIDGTEFDSSYKRGQPIQFPLNGVIPCWTEGVQRMKPGGKAKLVCPSSIAYGEAGAGGTIPPNATLVFDVELLKVVKNDAKPAEKGKQPASPAQQKK